jgi:hypothetical protein
MPNSFDELTQRLSAAWKPHKQPRTARSFRCRCKRPVFFRNSQCLGCRTALGYDPERGELLPLEPVAPGLWRAAGEADGGRVYERCINFEGAAGCNWLVPLHEADVAGERAAPLCRACCLNRNVAPVSVPAHALLLGRIEVAKRRLVSQLIGLGLPVRSRIDDPEGGLAFDLLASTPGGPPVMTGHASGLITLNIEEADHPTRERVRKEMNEPYRTLLGHFRHEVGHYYWDLLIRDTEWIAPFRSLFGDERQSYAEALKRNYTEGPPHDWPTRFVSSYASMHPWEDWAETWAHYLHMIDTVDTALSFGLEADDIEVPVEPWGHDALWRPDDPDADACLGFLNAWIELTAVFNELARSMGQQDFYPFVLPRAAVPKLQLIHLVVRGRSPYGSVDGSARSSADGKLT